MKRLKMINGMKILHRWSLALLFSTLIFLIMSVGTVVAISGLFQSPDGYALFMGYEAYGGGNIAEWLCQCFQAMQIPHPESFFYHMGITVGTNSFIYTINGLNAMGTSYMEGLPGLIPWILIFTMGVMIMALIVMAVIGIIMFLSWCLTGRTASFKSPIRISWTYAIIFTVFIGTSLGLEAAAYTFNEQACDFVRILKDNLLPLIFVGVSLVLAIINTLLYHFGIKGHLYSKYAKRILKSQDNRRSQIAGVNDKRGLGEKEDENVPPVPPMPVVQPYIQPIMMQPMVQPVVQPQQPAVETRQESAPAYIPAPHRDVNIPEKGAPITEATPKINKGLPAELSSIGGHAFSQNANLEIAVIPQGIKEIGPSAFSNCQNLKVVSIPVTVTKIGYNAFFGCRKLARINYGGRKSDWKNIKRGSNWLSSSGTTTVVCVDGAISVNPYH